MDFKLAPDEIAFQKELDEFMRREISRDLVEEVRSGEGYGPYTWDFLRKLGAKRWLAPHWPEEYGGMNAPYMYRFIVLERLTYYGLHYIESVMVEMCGPIILRYGSEEQKKEYLPRGARGEIEFALGYTEPEAGSDLAALEMRAVRDGEDYVINGQKLFNTRVHYSQYHWLLVRTNPNVPKHRGLSLFIVDLKSPGISIIPLQGMQFRTNQVFYDNVRVPAKNLVGEENRGWYEVASALDHERIAYGIPAEEQKMLEEMVSYCRQTQKYGQPLSKDPLVRQKIAQLAIEVAVARVLSYRVAWMLDQGEVPDYETALIKLVSTELKQRVANIGMQLLGLYSPLTRDSPWAQIEGEMQRLYESNVYETIGAGSSEIMRNVIAIRGLGLPRG